MRCCLEHLSTPFCLFLLLICFPVSTLAIEKVQNTWADVTVTTISGWTYTAVDVEVNPASREIWIIKGDGARKKLTYSNVRLIVDIDGKDITAKILGSQSSAPPQPPSYRDGQSEVESDAHSTFERTYRSGRRRWFVGPRFRFALSAGAGYGDAAGDYYEGFTAGPAFQVSGKITVSNEIYIGLHYRRLSVGTENKLNSIDGYDDNGYYVSIPAKFELSLEEIYFIIGYLSSPRDYSSVIGYIEAGLGSVGNKGKVTIETTTGNLSETVDESKLGLIMTGGLIIPFNKQLGLDLHANLVLTGNADGNAYDSYDDSVTGVVLGIGCNLALLFGDTK